MKGNLESATLRSSTILMDRKMKNLKVYNGGLGANPIKQHTTLIRSLIYNSNKKEYLPPKGLDKLNEQIKKLYNVDNVLVGNGLKEMIFILLLGCDCELFFVTPCWVSYIEQAKILNKKIHYIKTDIENNFKLTDILLEKTLIKSNSNKNKLLFLNNPTNPTGAIYTKEELYNISLICKKYDIIVFADEIYMELVHTNYKTESFLKYYNKTIVGSSLSKNFSCGGYRVGWLTFTKELNELYNKLHTISSSVYSCASHCLQCVAYDALLLQKDLKEHLKKQQIIFTEISKITYNKFKEIGIISSIPMGAWYIFLSFEQYKEKLKKNNINNDQELCLKLINDIGLITVAGSNFGYKGFYLRYSIVDLYFENNDNSIENKNVDQFNFLKMSNKIIEGINELNLWLNKIYSV